MMPGFQSPTDPGLPSPAEFTNGFRGHRAGHRILASLALRRWLLQLSVRAACKRAVDIAGALAGLIVLSPLLCMTAAAIRLESVGPVFFRQIRVGKRARPFQMYKFRSMRVDAEASKAELAKRNESADGVLFKMKADPRVTRVGRLIRRYSIDELPQLFNVLLGHMSIVGPRPALPAEVRQYDLQARKRLQAKPGLTCFWQIGGRSELSFSQQVDLDLRYLRDKSLIQDVRIIARTVPAVVSGRGAY